jgi:tetratricopeptide (TPR) repeat protein
MFDQALGNRPVRQIPAVFVIFLAAMVGAQAARVPDGTSARQRYDSCLNLTKTNPQAALHDAQNWQHGGGGAPAAHCAALALVGLKQYGEAARRLDELARGQGIAGGAMRSELFDQAGNAWMLDGKARAAQTSFSQALAISSNDPDLFADLARAHAMSKDWQGAEADLTAALALAPGRPDLLVLRASARQAEGNKRAARADIDAALRDHPDLPGALLERGAIKMDDGDVAGARADWQRTIASDPQSGAAALAREHIEAMDAAVRAAKRR